MRRGASMLVGSSSGAFRHGAPRRTAISAMAKTSMAASTYSTLSRTQELSSASHRCRGAKQDYPWQRPAVRWAHIQHGTSSGSSAVDNAGAGKQGRDIYPPPGPPPQRRRANNTSLGAKKSAGVSASPSSHAASRSKGAMRSASSPRAEVADTPQNDAGRVSTTDPEDPPPDNGKKVPLPDDPSAPSRKEEAPTKDSLKTPSPSPRQDPQGIKKQEQKKTLKERVIGLWENVKYLFRFYYNGVKQIWKNRAVVADLRKTIAEREQQGKGGMLWMEKSVIELHQSDLRKLPLFVAILVILEEILPLVVIYAPSLLPSTCILPSQVTKLQSQEERRRGMAIQKLAQQRDVTATVSLIGQADQREGVEVNSSPAKGLSTLSDLSSPILSSLADVFGLRAWGPKSLLLSRINAHVRLLRSDDAYLKDAFESRHKNTSGATVGIAAGTGALSQWDQICQSVWLQRACARRGLRAFEASESDMARNLEAYLHLVGESSNPLHHALVPLALYDGTRSHLIRLERETQKEKEKGLRQRTSEVVASVVTAEKSKEASTKGSQA